MYINPQKDDFYLGDNGKQYHSSKHTVTNQVWRMISADRARKISAVHQIQGAHTILEYGVGTGWNLESLAIPHKLGFDVVNVLDLQATSIQFVESIESIPVGSIPTILCHHVLEHLPDPLSTIKNMINMLSDDGVILLFVPFENKRRDRWPSSSDTDHHLYSWTPRSLSNLINTAGGRVARCEIKPFGYDRFSAVFAQRLHMPFMYTLIKATALLFRPNHEIFIEIRR